MTAACKRWAQLPWQVPAPLLEEIEQGCALHSMHQGLCHFAEQERVRDQLTAKWGFPKRKPLWQ